MVFVSLFFNIGLHDFMCWRSSRSGLRNIDVLFVAIYNMYIVRLFDDLGGLDLMLLIQSV